MKKKLSIFLSIFTLLLSAIFSPLNKVFALEQDVRSQIEEMTSSEKEFLLNRFLVKYREDIPDQGEDEKGNVSITAIKGETKIKNVFLEENSIEGVVSLSITDEDLSVTEKDDKLDNLRFEMLAYALDPRVEIVQPVYIYKLSAWQRSGDRDYPGNDFNATNHWYYDKGNVREMWQDQNCLGGGSNCGGDDSIIVAVLDTGAAVEDRTSNFYGESTQFDFDIAPELNTGNGFNLYTNSGETNCSDGIDNDLNDYIDDCHGFNAYEEWICYVYAPYIGVECNSAQWSETGHPNDDFGHGSYVSSLIASNVDNAGANPPGSSVSPAHDVTIMPIKVGERITHASSPGTFGPEIYTDDVCNALRYARVNGADVINMSFGGGGYDSIFEYYVNEAYNAGITLVAASGNESTDWSMQPVSYPAAFNNVIAVGATDSGNNRANYSNGGSNLDIVAAVGDGGDAGNATWQQSFACFDNYPVTCHQNVQTNYKSFSTQYGIGTSYASPQVSGAIALMLSKDGTLNNFHLYNLLTGRTTVLDSAESNYTGYGLLNFEEAYSYLDTVNSTSNPNFNPSANGDNNTDIIAMHRSNTKVDVTPSTGTNFGGGSSGYQVWNTNTGYDSSNWIVLEPADVDGDGTKDLIAFKKSSTRVNVTLSYSDSFGRGYKNSKIWNRNTGYDLQNWQLLNPADVNGDGKADLIAYNRYTTKIDVTLSDGLSFGGGNLGYQVWNSYTGYDTPYWQLLDPADVNGDGNADLIAYHRYTTKVNVTLSNGSNFGGGNLGYQVWNSQTGYDTPYWQLLDPADVNGDGNVDLIAYHRYTTKVNVTLSNGSNFGGGSLGYQVWNSQTGYDVANWCILN